MTRIVERERLGNERRHIIDENEWNDEGIIKESSAISGSKRNSTKRLRNGERRRGENLFFTCQYVYTLSCVCVR
jgi:hypothetical protein